MARFVALAALALTIAAASTRPAHAEPPPRKRVSVIVAVVERDVITSVELERKMKPYHLKLDQAVGKADTPQRRKALATVYSDLLQRMIEARLIAGYAAVEHLTVSREDVDRALEVVATSQRVDVPKVLAMAKDMGLSEADYRGELAEQLLEGRAVSRAMRDKSKLKGLSDAERTKRLREVRDALVARLRSQVHIEVRL